MVQAEGRSQIGRIICGARFLDAPTWEACWKKVQVLTLQHTRFILVFVEGMLRALADFSCPLRTATRVPSTRTAKFNEGTIFRSRLDGTIYTHVGATVRRIGASV